MSAKARTCRVSVELPVGPEHETDEGLFRHVIIRSLILPGTHTRFGSKTGAGQLLQVLEIIQPLGVIARLYLDVPSGESGAACLSAARFNGWSPVRSYLGADAIRAVSAA